MKVVIKAVSRTCGCDHGCSDNSETVGATGHHQVFFLWHRVSKIRKWAVCMDSNAQSFINPSQKPLILPSASRFEFIGPRTYISLTTLRVRSTCRGLLCLHAFHCQYQGFLHPSLASLINHNECSISDISECGREDYSIV